MNIAFVPVRCGSQAIKWKNIKPFCGKPLVYWCVNALQECAQIDAIYVATDCKEIEDVVRQFNMPKVNIYQREAQNATDTSGTEQVMLEFLLKNKFSSSDNFILVQATNPFVTHSDFSQALVKLKENQVDSLLSCCRIKRFFWNENGTPKNYDYTNRPLRQNFKGELVENGAFYINTVGSVIENKNRLGGRIGLHEMPEYSFTEIDEYEDWVIAEKIFMKYKKSEIPKKRIKILLTDVDGVLTDAGMYYSEKGDELKKFSTYDGMAFSILKKHGIKTGIITSENRKINANRAKKLNIDFVFQGVTDKWMVVQEICRNEHVAPEEIGYVGDDMNDLEVLQHVGMAACPSSAIQTIKNVEGILVLNTKGGEGVIRELTDNYIEL